MRKLTTLLVLLSLLLLVPAPARAATTRIELLASAAQTASAQGGGVSVRDAREIIIFVNCTASSTPTTLDVYLQSSSDGGTTWFDISADVAMLTDGDATETAATTNKRDVLDGTASCASPVKATARYRVFGDYVRVAWFISGTSFTFGVKAIVKT